MALPIRGAKDSSYIFALTVEQKEYFGYCYFFISSNARSSKRHWRQRSVCVLSSYLQPAFFVPLCKATGLLLQREGQDFNSLMPELSQAINLVETVGLTEGLQVFQLKTPLASACLVIHAEHIGCQSPSTEVPVEEYSAGNTSCRRTPRGTRRGTPRGTCEDLSGQKLTGQDTSSEALVGGLVDNSSQELANAKTTATADPDSAREKQSKAPDESRLGDKKSQPRRRRVSLESGSSSRLARPAEDGEVTDFFSAEEDQTDEEDPAAGQEETEAEGDRAGGNHKATNDNTNLKLAELLEVLGKEERSLRVTKMDSWDEAFLRDEKHVVTEGRFALYLPSVLVVESLGPKLLPAVFCIWEQVVRNHTICVIGPDPDRVSQLVLSLVAMVAPLIRNIKESCLPLVDAPFMASEIKTKILSRRQTVSGPLVTQHMNMTSRRVPQGSQQAASGRFMSGPLAAGRHHLARLGSPRTPASSVERSPEEAYIVGTTNLSILEHLEHVVDCVVIVDCHWDRTSLPATILSCGNTRPLSTHKFAKAPTTWLKTAVGQTAGVVNSSYLYCASDPSLSSDQPVTGVWLRESSAISVDNHKALLHDCCGGSVAKLTAALTPDLVMTYEQKLRDFMYDLTKQFLTPFLPLVKCDLRSLRLNPLMKLQRRPILDKHTYGKQLAEINARSPTNNERLRITAGPSASTVEGCLPEGRLPQLSAPSPIFNKSKQNRIHSFYCEFFHSKVFDLWFNYESLRSFKVMRRRQVDILQQEKLDLKEFAAIELENGAQYIKDSLPECSDLCEKIYAELQRRER
ncbi:hypothetical protein GNI_039280 [Gregarina niphandrodes]|uniref:Uncharacterized protein n=1 Tax=Gregarina niphandrodes TaxID=110365 RepID=A0A023BAE2_GRENI|nr:hypothetical protein GNI_039280 [Gregarina niphandrodes]EZG78242.1 hypothetical protein GNI_039280 [Gregarina niphandrodes]|eukprot:XP_011129384.1 hypothetical protein GNI_039280 [Gregarina niphandrodes]